MKLSCKVRGFRGAERCDIVIDPVCLAAGLNYAGKSSLAQAVAAAVCGTPVPYFKASKPDKPLLSKTDSKELVRGGMDQGSVEISVDGKVACSVKWPDLSIEGDGRVQCSKFAAGLLNVIDLDDGDRQKFFAGLLQAMPTPDDLRLALMEAIPELGDDNSGAHLKKLLDMVNVSGWDASHTHAKETGSRLKGQWEAHSQERYGSAKAEGWRPKEWRPDLAEKTLEAIGTECTAAEEKWQQAVAQRAVDGAELEALTLAANDEAAAHDAYTAAKDVDDTAGKKVAERKVKIAQSQVPEALACPHCGGLVEVHQDLSGVKLTEATMGPDERASALAKLKADQDILVRLEQARVGTSASLAEARRRYEGVKGATEKLKTARERKGGQDAVDVALDLVNGLKKDKAMIEAVQQCARLYNLIQANQKIVDVLAPEGLRRQKLVRALAKFNQKFLAVLCQEASYPAVTLDNELEVLYGGRRHFLLSDSEKYRVKAVLQLAIALYDKSPLVICDGADILDAAGRNGLFAMAQSCESVSFLICMTMADRKKVPDLAKAGMGESYWIEDGIAYPLGTYPEKERAA